MGFVTTQFVEEQLLLIALLATITGVVVVIEHMLFGRMWRTNELARRVLGHATVLVIIGVPAVLGYLDFMTWLMACVVTAVAGGLVGAIEVTERERRRVEYVEDLRAWADQNSLVEVAEGVGNDEDRG